MSIDFGWVLIVVGLLGLLPSLRLLVARRRPTRTQWLRVLACGLLLVLGALEVQRRGDWHPLRQPPAAGAPLSAGQVTQPAANSAPPSAG